MKFTTSLNVLLLSGSFAYASSLAVYQDSTFYHFTPQNHFIGFTQNVKAKCEDTALPLSVMLPCPLDDRLCQLLTNWKNVEEKVKAVQANTKVLEQLISLPKPKIFDANASIEAAKRIGEEQARLTMLEGSLNEEAQILQDQFLKQAPSQLALQTVQKCDKEVELTVPRGYVSFSTYYEADIKEQDEVTVTQYLSVTNRSGIDIEADKAMFYYRSADQHLYPTHFYPWIVSKYEPRAQKVYKSAMPKSVEMDRMMMAEERAAAPTPVVSYEDAREYKIEKLVLPSTGVSLDVKVVTWNAALSCEIRAYPYENTIAFHVCSFNPKYQIDTDRWKVRSSGKLINKKAVGEYWQERYDLYTEVENDIKVQRRPIVNKERETGIFGGTARKKDGYTLTIINKSDKTKKLTIYERIPTSTTEEIESKLLKISSEKKVNYNELKDGQIEIKLTLAPHEKKEIEVLFEISHDKDLKVHY